MPLSVSALVILAGIFFLYAYFIETGLIHVIRSRIRTSGIMGRYTFLHITDLHLYKKMRKGNLNKIKDTLKLWADWVKFDFIFITGDFIDDNSGITMIKDVVGELKSRFGKYAVLGNHDYFQYNFLHIFNPLFFSRDKKPTDIRALKNALLDADIKLLINQTEKTAVQADEIWITGIDSKFFKEKRLHEIQFPGGKGLAIVLSHYPEAINYYRGKADIFLSGHTHGGQITFFGVPLIIKSGIKKRYSRGISAHGDTALYVSKGLGVSRYFPFRFFARPDFNIVDILGENHEN